MRPALKAGLLPVWRDRDTIQFGVDPRRAFAVAGLGQTAAVLSLLDGSRDRGGVIAAARAYGVPPEASGRVLAVLAAAGCSTTSPPGCSARCPRRCAPGWRRNWPPARSPARTGTAGRVRGAAAGRPRARARRRPDRRVRRQLPGCLRRGARQLRRPAGRARRPGARRADPGRPGLAPAGRRRPRRRRGRAEVRRTTTAACRTW